MTNELFLIINQNEIQHTITGKALFEFNNLNHRPFLCTAQKIYNDILQNKIHAGDSIIKYIKIKLTDKEVEERLEKSCKYDYFFDNNGILKCDLNTNKNILIKNFLNTIIYYLTDNVAKMIILLKLNNKYPFIKGETLL